MRKIRQKLSPPHGSTAGPFHPALLGDPQAALWRCHLYTVPVPGTHRVFTGIPTTWAARGEQWFPFPVCTLEFCVLIPNLHLCLGMESPSFLLLCVSGVPVVVIYFVGASFFGRFWHFHLYSLSPHTRGQVRLLQSFTKPQTQI